MRAWLVSLTNASRLCVPPQPALPAGAAKAGGSASNESDTRVMRQDENARRQAGTGGILRGVGVSGEGGAPTASVTGACPPCTGLRQTCKLVISVSHKG